MEDSGPYIIVFEGPPLMGKTTQADLLEEFLEDRGYYAEVLKRATDYCPTREEINELREEADGWTRELDRISPEEETELWARYYREKTEAVEEIREEENPDYIIFDRYFLSLIPTQELALDESLQGLLQRYREDIEELDVDIKFLLNTEEDISRGRYREREGQEIPEKFHAEVQEVKRNYRELAENFGFVEIDAAQPKKTIFQQVKKELESRNMV